MSVKKGRTIKKYTEFEESLIKNIPSNIYVGKLLGRTGKSISSKRYFIKGAVRSTSIRNLKKLKQALYPKVLEICEKFSIDPKTLKGVKNVSTKPNKSETIPVSSTLSILVKIQNIPVMINQNDSINIEEGRIVVLSRRVY